MRTVISHPTLVLFRDAAGKSKGAIDRLAANAQMGIDQLSNMALSRSNEQYKSLKQSIKANASHTEISSNADALLMQCKLELFDTATRFAVIPPSATIARIKQSSESLAWIMAYAIYAKYEYPITSKVDTIIALLDRQYHDDVFDVVDGFEQELLDFIPLMQAVDSSRESISQRLIAYSQIGDDLISYEVEQHMGDVRSAISGLEKEYEDISKAYPDDKATFVKTFNSLWKSDDFKLNADGLMSTVQAAYQKVESDLTGKKTSFSFVKPDVIQALLTSVEEVKQRVRKRIEQSKRESKAYAGKAQKGHEERIKLTRLAVDTMVKFANMYRERPNRMYNRLETSIVQYQSYLKDISIEAMANRLLNLTTGFATNQKFLENMGPKIEGLSFDDKKKLIDDLGNTINQRSKYQKWVKRVKKFSLIVFAFMTVDLISGLAQKYLWQTTVAWYTLPAGASLLITALACLAITALFRHWEMKSCMSFHSKIDALEAVRSEVMPRPSMSRPIREDKYMSPQELELQARGALDLSSQGLSSSA
ncbi:hypothetical protein N9C31_02455 [Gammaproteobacteria bacterium]|nr:hypothetical protein [Gammaproteobacteria bacterium]